MQPFWEKASGFWCKILSGECNRLTSCDQQSGTHYNFQSQFTSCTMSNDRLNPFLLQIADNINKLKCNETINALFYGHEKMNLWTGRFPSRNFYSSISFCHSSTSAIYTPASSEIQSSKGIDYSTFFSSILDFGWDFAGLSLSSSKTDPSQVVYPKSTSISLHSISSTISNWKHE